MTEQDYRSHSAINYSLLAKLDRHPSATLSEEKDFSDGLTFGSLLDCMMTSPEDLNTRFAVPPASMNIPTGQMEIFTRTLIGLGELTEDNYRVAFEAVGAKKGSVETFKERFEKEGKQFYEFTLQSSGKMVVTPEMQENARIAKETLLTHKFSKKWFVAGFEQEVLFQTPIIFTLPGGQQGKALLDIIVIDHLDKVIKPADLKSTGDYASGWLYNSFFKWRYDLQASFYSEAVLQWAEEKYPGYKVDLFTFIVISSQQPTKPYVYASTWKDIDCGKHGGITKSGRKTRGWLQLVDDLTWHKEKDLWDYPREVYENEGEILIDMFNDEHHS